MPGPGRKILPGQILNPNGGRGKGVCKKVIKKFTQQLVCDTFNDLINHSSDELKKIYVEGSTQPIIRQIIAKAMVLDLKEGRTTEISKVLERIIGPVPQLMKSQVTGASDGPLSIKWES